VPMQVGLRTSLHEPEPFSAGSSSHALSSRSPRLSTRPSVPKLPRELKIPPRSPRAGLRAGKMATPRTRSLAQPGPRSAVRRRQREAAGDPLFSPTLPRAAATVPIGAAGSSPRLMRIQSDDMALSAGVYGAIGSGVSGPASSSVSSVGQYSEQARLYEALTEFTTEEQAAEGTVHEWMRNYNAEIENFPSVALYCEMKLREVFSRPVRVQPDRLRTAVCCEIHSKMVSFFGQYGSIMSALHNEMCRAIYPNFDPNLPKTEKSWLETVCAPSIHLPACL
jgi:hypothetical protein